MIIPRKKKKSRCLLCFFPLSSSESSSLAEPPLARFQRSCVNFQWKRDSEGKSKVVDRFVLFLHQENRIPVEGEYLHTQMLIKLKFMLKLKRFRAGGSIGRQDYQVGAFGEDLFPCQRSETGFVATTHRWKQVLGWIEKHFETLLNVNLASPTTHIHATLPPC